MSLQLRVASVLRGPRIDRINFYLGGLHISPQKLRAVGDAIASGQISVVIQSTGTLLSAAYSPHSNRMTLSNNQVTDTVIGQAGIVHEGVHALVDLYRCTNITVLDDEAVAYLTGVIYLRAAHTWVRGGTAEMAIFNSADNIAQTHRLYERSGVSLAWRDYEPLRQVISAHPAYSGIGNRQLTSGHGVP